MVETLIFKLSSIEKAEEEYKKLNITAEQHGRLNSFVKIIAQYIPLPERALRGFMWRAIREDQVERHVDLAEEARIADQREVDLETRIAGIENILSRLKNNLTRLLVHSEQEPLLDKAFDKVIDFYKEQFKKM